MIQEEYVTFETAKLLKEAGFPQWVMTPTGERDGVPCVKCYRKDGLLTDWIFMRGHKSAFSAPTQAQAMRWLRDEEYINAYVIPKWDMMTLYVAAIFQAAQMSRPKRMGEFFTYEAAAEAGIQTACNYLINYLIPKQK